MTEEQKRREEYWLWICSMKEIYRPAIARLIRYFGNPGAVYEAPEKEIRNSGCLNDVQTEALLRGRAGWDAEESSHELKERGITFISAEHEDFPERLKQIYDCPFGIFYRGRLPEKNGKTAGIVGARRCSSYGKQMAECLAASLAGCGVQIISGMAWGIDGYAQTAALDAGGESFAVLGSGVDVCYPAGNRNLYHRLEKEGGILSEYPPGREALALHFPMRNRIISGLSDVLLVIEAKERSGSLITADQAIEQGKDVYAVPGRIGDPLSAGCNRLISQGAGIVLSENELLLTLNLIEEKQKKNKKAVNPLETKENMLYSYLDLHPKSLHEIVGRVQLPVQEVLSLLTVLEMKGFIKEPMKNYYSRIN